MNIQAKPLNDISKEAILVLNNTIGIINTLRFLNQLVTFKSCGIMIFGPLRSGY